VPSVRSSNTCPLVVFADRREQQTIAVEVQVHVADEVRAAGPIERRQWPRPVSQRKDSDLVVETGDRQYAVALPVLRQTQRRTADAAFDQQQPVEVKQWIAQRDMLLESNYLQIELAQPLPAGPLVCIR